MTSGPYAKIVADSISPEGHRLTTFEVRFHRFVLAEFNTHRVFSRNSASSRAIPVGKNLDAVYFDPAIPVEWRAEQKGMQGGDLLEGHQAEDAKDAWLKASQHAGIIAEDLVDIGVHKSIVNRVLEPFAWHTVIVTATAWENFFAQRVSPLAQPEIRVVAEQMYEQYFDDFNHGPQELKEGEWHLPYITEHDYGHEGGYELLKKVSVARCARVSYLTHDGKRDIWKDLELYERLVSASPMHASPLEHVATPDPWNVEELEVPLSGGRRSSPLVVPKIGNFLGWRQHRLEVELERGIQSYG